MMDVKYRYAGEGDLPRIAEFVDYWLKGVGKRDGTPGATDDYFVSRKRHEDYVKKYKVLLALVGGDIIGWAVKTNKDVLIHLLVGGTFRDQGIGSEMLKRTNPISIRSKSDQESGDPAGFYEKHGYVRAGNRKLGKKHNIDIFVKNGDSVVEREEPKRSIDKLTRNW